MVVSFSSARSSVQPTSVLTTGIWLTAAMQVNLAPVSVEQNDAVRRLAGWGAILAIPTVVFSLYGMNFQFMPELSHRFGYPFAIGLMIVSAILPYLYFKRKGWL